MGFIPHTQGSHPLSPVGFNPPYIQWDFILHNQRDLIPYTQRYPKIQWDQSPYPGISSPKTRGIIPLLFREFIPHIQRDLIPYTQGYPPYPVGLIPQKPVGSIPLPRGLVPQIQRDHSPI